MRKFIALTLALAVLCGMAVCVAAEPAVYALGDKADDFTVTLSDGSEVSLYGLLKEKKAVLINFWASWCGPCRNEFPHMEQAYEAMSDDIGVIALSCEAADTDEIVLKYKEDLGMDSLPMGLDIGLAKRYGISAYPTSVIVDRFGTICFMQAGSIPSPDMFIRLFSVFTGDDYTQSVLLNDIPKASFTGEYPSNESLEKALGVTGGKISLSGSSDSSVWPFVPSESGEFAEAANGSEMDTQAVLTAKVDAAAGEALKYDYRVCCKIAIDGLTVAVDGETVKYYGGDRDWQSDYVKFDEAGEHTVEFSYKRAAASNVVVAYAMLRGFEIMPAEQVAEADAKIVSKPKTLEGSQCTVEPVGDNLKWIVVNEDMGDKGSGTQRMPIVTDDKVKLLIKIGADVNENFAFVADSTDGKMLSELPYDDVGYYFETPIASMADGNAYPYTYYSAYTNVVDLTGGTVGSCTCFASEADVDEYGNMIKSLAEAMGFEKYEMTWAYEDGSDKLSEAPAEAETETSAPDDGTADYVIITLDEAGNPVQGAMIQICDVGTCTVAQTDAEGKAYHHAARYPYEIHMLMAAGYQSDGQVYIMPEEGGELTITLKK